jgi:hypothetical protein
MATIMEMRELKGYLDGLRQASQRGAVVGLMEAVNFGLAEAKKNARSNFTGRWGYRKTGALLNSIFAGFDMENPANLEGVIGVRANKGRNTEDGETKPYGRIQEYGGEIKPVKAKWLWQPLWDRRPSFLRFISPRQFIAQMRSYPQQFAIIPTHDGMGRVAVWQGSTKAVKLGDKQRTFAAARERAQAKRENIYPLFLLRKRTVIPPRPYVTPAAQEAGRRMPGMILKRILEQQGKQR